ncbi:endonuclease/exonuclease/phosphatase family protein [Vibrio aquimaris]|uniref:Endonuclease/Exonuclease/phosphatase family protein n=1 Tax=Vibrio aquimaris TaxID=2587862 RepID=A0A5P9CHQ2_9VIBR|nr:hypothetical protein [Vibrio aquimaris]QFT25859.1 Endonuclease/Exonuclease/phosphatase family protein [Vibrio aquimaris]
MDMIMEVNSSFSPSASARVNRSEKSSYQPSFNIKRVFNCCLPEQELNSNEEHLNNLEYGVFDKPKAAHTIQVFTHNNANQTMSSEMCESILTSTSDIVFISTEEMKNLSGVMRETINGSKYVIVYNSAQKMLTVTKPKELFSLFTNPASTAQITLVKKGIAAPIIIDKFTYRDVLNNPNKGGTITIQSIDSMKFAMVNIHLDSRDQDERKKEINDLLCKINNKHADIDNIIIAGDFNTRNRKVDGRIVRALQDKESFRSELGVPLQYEITLPMISPQENTYKWEAGLNAEAKQGSKRQKNGEMQTGYLDGVVILTPKGKIKDETLKRSIIVPEGNSIVGPSFGSDHRSVSAKFAIEKIGAS